MLELPWATPEAIGNLAIVQLMALYHAEPPGDERVKSAEEYEQVIAARKSAEASWNQ